MLFNSESSCPQLFQAQKLATLSSLDDHRQTFQSFGRDGLFAKRTPIPHEQTHVDHGLVNVPHRDIEASAIVRVAQRVLKHRLFALFAQTLKLAVEAILHQELTEGLVA